MEIVNRELQYESIKHISLILNIHENHPAHHRNYCKRTLLTKRVTVYRVSSDNEGFWLKQWRWVLPSVPNAGSYVKYWRGRRGLRAKHPTTTLQVIVVEALGVEYPKVKRYL